MGKNIDLVYTFFQQLPKACLILSSEGVIIDANKKALELLDTTYNKISGTHIKLLQEGRKNITLEYILRNLDLNKEHNTIIKICRANKIYHVEFVIKKYRDGYICILSDIEQDIEYQQKIEVNYEITNAFVTGKNTEDTLYKIIKVLGKFFKWGYAAIWLLDKDGELSYTTSWHVPKLKNTSFVKYSKKSLDINEDFANFVLRTKKPKWLSDYKSSFNTKRSRSASEFGINSAFGIPLKTEKKIIGVLEFFSFKKTYPDQEFYNLIFGLSNRIADFIQRRKIYTELKESEERYRDLVELAPYIILKLDSKGKIIWLNEAYTNITEINRNDLFNKPIADLIHESNKKLVKQKLRGLLSKNPKTITARINTKAEDNIIFGEIRLRPNIHDGKIHDYLGVIVDLTTRINLEKQKDLWVGIATHEIKTPLTGIKAFTQILLSKSIDKKYLGYLATINKLVDKTTDIMDDLLDITRIRSGTFDLDMSEVNINFLIEELLNVFKKKYPTHIFEFKKDKVDKIFVDEKRISQTITNLISNAVKYSPNNQLITVKTKIKSDTFLFSVTDRGIGISKPDLARIFDLLYRVKKSRKRHSGLGMGLFIAKSIINKHKGKIWVESKLGKGSTFHFSIPMGKESNYLK